MASNCTAENPPYFQTVWAATSVYGLANVIAGLMIVGITGRFSAVVLVPIATSAGSAFGNGLGYYVFRLQPPPPLLNQAVAYVFGEITWMIHEAGLPFYGYAILVPILRGNQHVIFLTLFWGCISIILVVRVALIVFGLRFMLDEDPSPVTAATYSTLNARLHLGYFVPIAMAETVTAIFLLKRFNSTLRSSISSGLKGAKLYRYFLRSTEIRLASLALIGIARSITFSFAAFLPGMGMGPMPVAMQIDEFVMLLGSWFPVVMLIDILASRLIYVEEKSNANSISIGSFAVTNAGSGPHHSASRRAAGEHHDMDLLDMPDIERNTEM
ncbi:hypothetical protein RB595_005945 [Gaeumannomyces hyphopodioides]